MHSQISSNPLCNKLITAYVLYYITICAMPKLAKFIFNPISNTIDVLNNPINILLNINIRGYFIANS